MSAACDRASTSACSSGIPARVNSFTKVWVSNATVLMVQF